MNEQTILTLSEHPSASRRRQALDALFDMQGTEQVRLAFKLLKSPHRDIRDGVLDLASAQQLTSDKVWKEILIEEVKNHTLIAQDELWRQNLLVLISRLDRDLPEALVAFYRSHLDDESLDVCYQALCIAELQAEEGEAYLEHLKKYARSDDEDLRIVSTQGIGRLKPVWAEEELIEMARFANGQEAFHILLARLSLRNEDKKAELIEELKGYLKDDRYTFPSILALKNHGSKADAEALIDLAQSFFGEPTLKVMAAEAAAYLGEPEGLKLLENFAKSKRSNPVYASEALEKLRSKSEDKTKK